jgi:hypothetical protein
LICLNQSLSDQEQRHAHDAWRTTLANPFPVDRPLHALVIDTTGMNGQEISITQACPQS